MYSASPAKATSALNLAQFNQVAFNAALLTPAVSISLSLCCCSLRLTRWNEMKYFAVITFTKATITNHSR